MRYSQIPEWMKKVEEILSERRYRHTLGVAYTAASLAMRYGEDMEDAFLGGLFHDVAKEHTPQDTIRLCQESGIVMTSFEEQNPVLLHGKLGAEVTKQQFGITDQRILNAICYHTTGRPGMNLLEKILFIADYIEPLRDRRVGDLGKIRPLAFSDLDAAIVEITGETLRYLERAGKEIDSLTRETGEYYRKRMRQDS